MTQATEVKQQVITDYRTHATDTGSAEVQIALLSTRIDHLTEHFRTHKKDNHSRRGLLKMVARRRKLLDYLKRTNTPSYDALIGRLGLRR